MTNEKELKCLVIFYHKNIFKLYDKRWIFKSIKSISNQKYQNFDIWELNYGDDNTSIINIADFIGKSYIFYNKKLDNHVYAMYYLINKGFYEHNYDVIFNTNLDDYYHPQRFEKQLQLIKLSYPIVFTYWIYIEEIDGKDYYKTHKHCLSKRKSKSCHYCSRYGNCVSLKIDKNTLFNGNEPNKQNIMMKLLENTNVLCHPSACYTKKIFNMTDNYGNLIRYKNDKPYEDLFLWQKIVKNPDIEIGIVPEQLVYYRIHGNQVSKTATDINNQLIIIRRIGILLVCTGKYKEFCNRLIESIEKNFLQDSKKIYFFFSDDEKFIEDIAQKNKITHYITKIKQRGFPADTLYRYHYFLTQKYNLLLNTDFVYYFDVDMCVNSVITSDILPIPNKSLVGVIHPGFYKNNKNGSPEININSTAYINPQQYKNCYIAGGFNGGITEEYIKMAETIKTAIEIDDENELIAIWHDESHLNKYFTYNYEKFKIVDSEYCYPESWNIPFQKKILALDKNHSFIRTKQNMCITVNLQGDIGDKLFIVATSIAYVLNIKKYYNTEVTIVLPTILKNPSKSYRNSIFSSFYRSDIEKMNWDIIIKYNSTSSIKYENKHLINLSNPSEFLELFNNEFLSSNSNVVLDGFFKSYTFFNEYHTDILEYFKLPKDKEEYINNLFSGIANLFENQTVSIYIDKFTYIQLLKNEYDNEYNQYYLNAMNIVKQKIKNPYFIIYIEGDEYDKINLFRTLINVYYINDKYSDYILLYLMAKCNHYILSNSTIQWWSNYLNIQQDKIIISSKLFDQHLSFPTWIII